MKMRNKLVSLLAVLSATSLSVLVIQSYGGDNTNYLGNESIYGLSLDSSNRLFASQSGEVSGAYSFKTNLGNSVRIQANKFLGELPSDAWHSVASGGGNFYLMDAITEMRSISITTAEDASLVAFFNITMDYGASATQYNISTTAGVAYTLTFSDTYPSYFQINNASSSSITIKDITIAYYCGATPSPSTSESREESSSSETSSESSTESTTSSSSEEGYAPSGYSLYFADEFEGDSLNLDNWSYQIGNGYEYGIWEWGNGEAQYYKEENTTVSDGALHITAKKEVTQYGTTTYQYTSSRLRSYNKVSCTYGYIEAKIKVDAIQGLWPAFWMLPETTYNNLGWPYSGEIDIMELRGRLPYQTTSALHSANSGGGDAYSTSTYNLTTPISEYHYYGCLWTSENISFMVDGVTHLSVPKSTWINDYSGYNGGPAPFDKDFHILLNLAIGGHFDGYTYPPSDFTSGTMDVDYVRIYQ